MDGAAETALIAVSTAQNRKRKRSMTIEEKVFQRKRFLPEALERYGFQKTEDGYAFRADFLDGEFSAILSVDGTGAVEGDVTDKVSGEPYTPLRAERFQGAFVNTVRSAYEALLSDIAVRCCCDVPFVSDQANRIAERIFRSYGVEPDFPWGQSPHEHSGVFRHAKSGKWFALIMRIRRGLLTDPEDLTVTDVINLKIDTKRGRPKIDGVFPAYHMNHSMWITVTLDDTLSDDRVSELIETSYRMTGGKAKENATEPNGRD